jgi:hypothetical protein
MTYYTDIYHIIVMMCSLSVSGTGAWQSMLVGTISQDVHDWTATHCLPD